MRVSICPQCSKFIDQGAKRCDGCAPKRAKPKHSSAAYKRRRDAVVTAAKADRSTVCALCLKPDPPPGLDARWSAEHTDRDDETKLAAAHLGCNSAKGNRDAAAFRRYVAKRWPGWFD